MVIQVYTIVKIHWLSIYDSCNFFYVNNNLNFKTSGPMKQQQQDYITSNTSKLYAAD